MPTNVFTSGPWKGVRDTNEPFDDSEETLQDALNCYVPDPESGSGIFARPGCDLLNGGSAISASNVGRCVYTMQDDTGTSRSFLFFKDKVFRIDAGPVYTDVTPANVSITTSSAQLYCCALAGKLIVTDGQNRPWSGSDLGATPITGTHLSAYTLGAMLSADPASTKLAIAAGGWQSGATYGYYAGGTSTLPAANVTLGQWVAYRVYFTSTGVLTLARSTLAAYATEAAARAALPANPAGAFAIGEFTVQATGGFNWVANTDALTGGTGGTPAAATNFYETYYNPWSAYGRPVVYAGCLFFIANQLNGVSARTTILWSEPNQPTVGYYQTNYANWWTLTQTGQTPIYALFATNTALYYFRDQSIGAVTGTPSLSFSGSATHDIVSLNIGTIAPATVVGFGDTVYFADALGRPWRFAAGTTPEPIWLQMRQQVETQLASGAFVASAASTYAWAVIEPNLNICLMASYVPSTSSFRTTVMYAFDAQTGRYMGQWTLFGGVIIYTAGIIRDANGQPQLTLMAHQQLVGGSAGYAWSMARTYEGVWKDNATTLSAYVQTNRLGFTLMAEHHVVDVRAVEGTQATPMQFTTTTTTGTHTSGAITPASSSDGTYFAIWSADMTTAGAYGRGIQVKINPTTTTSQWRLYQIQARTTTDIALPGDR